MSNILRSQTRSDGNRGAFALRCLGEALVYTASNDPRNMLRHEGTMLSRLAAGFALERFDAGKPLEGIAGVEAFRALAIRHGDVQATFGHHIHELEVKLLTDVLLGNVEEPTVIATDMLSQHQKSLEADLATLLHRGNRIVLWYELWNGELLGAKIKSENGELRVQTQKLPIADWMVTLPEGAAPPGRLREQRVLRTLTSSWQCLGPLLEGHRPTDSVLLIAPSFLGTWPIDAAESIFRAQQDDLRSVAFAPTIAVGAAARAKISNSPIARVLIVSYAGADLPGTAQEVSIVKSIYGHRATVLGGDRLNRSAVIDELTKDYDVIHFCGHGEFDPVQPMQSKIFFHEHQKGDGFVTAADIVACERIGRSPCRRACRLYQRGCSPEWGQ